MMNNPLKLFKCHGCRQILWLSKLSQIGDYELDEGKPENWKSAQYPNSLSIDEFFEFLGTSSVDKDEEIYVRMRILWSFNDRVRMGLPQFISSSDKENWTWNIARLLEVLDWKISENRLLAGELLRYLEDWGFAIEILDSINDPRLKKIGSEVVSKCLEKNSQVFQF
jgi:hypothetical protein